MSGGCSENSENSKKAWQRDCEAVSARLDPDCASAVARLRSAVALRRSAAAAARHSSVRQRRDSTLGGQQSATRVRGQSSTSRGKERDVSVSGRARQGEEKAQGERQHGPPPRVPCRDRKSRRENTKRTQREYDTGWDPGRPQREYERIQETTERLQQNTRNRGEYRIRNSPSDPVVAVGLRGLPPAHRGLQVGHHALRAVRHGL